ncbi:MAG: Hpt domain-containing protein [Actinomycetota bacterium]|nr:Hpt domain-containing protein [Actinomycetota bacterium]
MTDYQVATERVAADRPGTARPVGSMGAVIDAAVIDAAVIDQLASITDAEGLSVLGELLQAFLAAAPARLEAIDHALAGADLAGVGEQAHALTGSSASFGATGMASLCRRLRATAEEDDVDGSRALVVSLHTEFGRVRSSLVTLMRSGV